MTLKAAGVLILWLIELATAGLPLGGIFEQQRLSSTAAVTPALFSELERLARLVDISYCIGNSGLGKPFNCISRCNEFPSLSLVKAWHTGLLMSDSCGYIAVDHGSVQRGQETGHSEEGNETIVVAFRGTYSITNTVIDLSTVPQEYVPYPAPGNGNPAPGDPDHACTNCTVHMGFMRSWETTRTIVVPQLLMLRDKYPGAPIHLVGHSLGGALACLAALELKLGLGWDNLVITTFGEPRVGNGELAKLIDAVFALNGDVPAGKRSYRRVTHRNDPVPLLPLTEWGYNSHAGEIFISKGSLPPSESDLLYCSGDADPHCSAEMDSLARYELWQLFFAHRDYFWRLGLCIPGGDPTNWNRGSTSRSKAIDEDEL